MRASSGYTSRRGFGRFSGRRHRDSINGETIADARTDEPFCEKKGTEAMPPLCRFRHFAMHSLRRRRYLCTFQLCDWSDSGRRLLTMFARTPFVLFITELYGEGYAISAVPFMRDAPIHPVFHVQWIWSTSLGRVEAAFRHGHHSNSSMFRSSAQRFTTIRSSSARSVPTENACGPSGATRTAHAAVDVAGQPHQQRFVSETRSIRTRYEKRLLKQNPRQP